MQGDRAGTSATAGEFRLAAESPGTGTIVLAISGDADLHAAPELRSRIAAEIDDGAKLVVVDLSETTFVDSMALGVLLGALKRLRASGGEMVLIVSRPDIRRIFEITLLDRIFPLYASRDEALSRAER